MFARCWRKADTECGVMHTHAFCRELINLLRETTHSSVEGISGSALIQLVADKASAAKTRAATVLSRMKIKSALGTSLHFTSLYFNNFAELTFILIFAYFTEFHSTSLSFHLTSHVAHARHSVKSTKVTWSGHPSETQLYQPLSLGPDCAYLEGTAILGEGKETHVIGVRIPSSYLASTTYAWDAFATLAELHAASSVIATSPLPRPLHANRTDQMDLQLSFIKEQRLIPLNELYSASLALSLLQSSCILDLWGAQLFSLLAAQSSTSSTSTTSPSMVVSDFGSAFVSTGLEGGRLALSSLSFTSSPTLTKQSLSSFARQLFTSVLGLSRNINLEDLLPPHRAIPLMQGCILNIHIKDKKYFTSHGRTVEDGNWSINVSSVSDDRAIGELGIVRFSSCEDSRNTRRTVTLHIETFDSMKILIDVFPMPKIGCISAAELVSALQFMTEKNLPDDYLLCTASLGCRPSAELDLEAISKEWARIVSQIVL